MFFKYPYTNLYNLNLDWIIQAIKELQAVVEPLDRVVNSVNGMTGDVEITKAILTQILGNMVETFNGRSGAVELTAEDVNATLIDIVWTSDPGETIHDLTQAELDEMYASGKRILIFVSNIDVADQVYFLQWYDSHAQPQEYTPTSALAGVASFNGMTGNVVATGDNIAVSATDTDTIAESLAEKVPVTRAVNGQQLSSNVNLDADDIPSQAISGATTVEMGLLNLQNSKVPNIRTVNGKQLLNDIVLNDEDIPSSVDGKTDVEEVLEYHSEEIAELDAEMQDKADVIISEASGAVASFDDRTDGLPVQSLTADIEPVQAGTGDPSPDNVRPITGWTGAKVTRTGKNLFNLGEFATKYPDKCSYSNGTLFVNPIIDMYRVGVPCYLPKNTVVNCTINEIGATGVFVMLVYVDGTTNSLNQNAFPFKISKDVKAIRFNWSTGGTFSISNFQVELGSTATDYEPYQGQTYDITLPTEAGTVYGGTLDVTSGMLTVDKTKITKKWSEFVNKSVETYAKGGIRLNDVNASIRTSAICDKLKYSVESSDYGKCFYITSDGAYIRAILPNTVSDDDEFTFVYPITTPTTYTLTPTEVTALLGVNNIWADTGDVSVSYRADTKTYVNQRVAELGPVNNLTSDSATEALAAAQGKALAGQIATKENKLISKTVAISAATTSGTIGSISRDTSITSSMVVVAYTINNPAYQTSDWVITITNGGLTVTGTASAATSINIILAEV